jgi:hypothetical protein
MLSVERDNMSGIYQQDRKENNRVSTYPFQKHFMAFVVNEIKHCPSR